MKDKRFALDFMKEKFATNEENIKIMDSFWYII